MERRSQHDSHALAAAAATAAITGVHPAGRQLMQAQYMLASWIDRHEHVAGQGAPLPPPLDHGPVELLQRVLRLTDSPHASAKLLDDAVILFMYGATFLQDQYDGTRGRARLEAFASEHHQQRERWKEKAQTIQKTWRTQRFHTNRLPVLSLDTSAYLQPDVDALMHRKTLDPQASIGNLHAVRVQVDEKELEKQVVSYAAELKRRVESRRRDEDELQRKQLKDQRLQEEKRKRMVVQRKKRHERACRRWSYFTTRLMRMSRQDNARNRPLADGASPFSEDDQQQVSANGKKALGDRSQSMMRVLKNPVRRTFVRQFVAKTIARGISRALCAYNMGHGHRGIDSLHDPASLKTHELGGATVSSPDTVLRLGLLLCDLHFGIKYTGLYQRFLERVGHQRGVRIEWNVFNCLKSQFPTQAHIRKLNGFLVAGGPNIGAVSESSHGLSPGVSNLGGPPIDGRRKSSLGFKKNRHFGRWRQRLLVLLRDLHSRKQILLGGLGLGHVLLAEALGARVGMREWEDGWCLLDPTIFSHESSANPHLLDRRLAQGMLGVRFLHGEFVQSFANDKHGFNSGRQFKSWRSPGEHSFVACFRDPLTLSIDGSPECGSFVFETLGEFYDRDKANRARQNRGQFTTTSVTPSRINEAGDGDDDNEDEDDLLPISQLTAPNLEDKRKRLGIIDASERVAHLFFDHFHRQVVTSSTSSQTANTKMAIAGVVCSSGILKVDESLRRLACSTGVAGVFVNASTSTDGHLVVTNPSAFALLLNHDKRIKEQYSKRRLSASSLSGQAAPRRNSVVRPPVLTLSMLRDHDRVFQGLVSPGSSNQLSPRTVRLPSIRRDDATLASGDEAIGDTSAIANRQSQFRRASSRLPHVASDDGASVLTLSQALSLVSKAPSQFASAKTTRKVFIRLLDEECKQTHDLLSISKADLRTAWLRLIAAIRIAELRNDQVSIVSRHSHVLDYIKRRRPMWTFVKDCRRLDVTHRKRVQKVAHYAAYADIMLLDQDFLLCNSANENDVLLRKAKSFGLEVYVAPRDESPKVAARQIEKASPKKQASFLHKKASGSDRSRRGLLPQEISAKTINASGSEYDMRVVEFMLLQFSGLDGVITSHPEAAIDAQQRIAAKNEAMQQVEQLFRDWQAKDSAKASSPKRTSNTPPQPDPTLDDDDPEDYVGGDSQYDSDDSIPEQEIAEEVARQLVEHAYVGSVAPATSGSFGKSGPVGVAALTPGSNSSTMTAAPFVPLRPLQPRSGDDVFGAGAIRRQNTARSVLSASSASGESRGRVSSIGSFRAALQRTSSTAQAHLIGAAGAGFGSDDTESEASHELRGPDPTSPRSTATLKPMSTRKILFVPR